MSGNWHKRGNIRGADGVGVPTGGQPGQALQKVGNSDFATAWANLDYADIVGKVPKSALPDIGNSTVPVASEAAMLNLPAVVGNMAIRTDIGKTFVLAEEPANVLENWVELVTTSDVQSVNGKTGNVTLTKSDVGLSNVNNTADSDKPVATQSVNGLLSKADKTKLDKASSGATFNTLVERDMTGSFSATRITLSSNPAANSHATTKEYVDAQVSSVAGGSVLSNTDWDAMRTTASTGVVEGWVKGCPAGGKINATYNMSNGFVKNPVWRLEVRPEGLNYVTQRATLLNCEPKFMIGFTWERIYDPVTSKWSAWTCVAGDTGEIRGQIGGSVTETPIEAPFRSIQNSSAYLYRSGEPLIMHRKAGMVNFYGAMTSTKTKDMMSSDGSVGPTIMYMAGSNDAPAGNPGGEYVLSGANHYAHPLQSGSYRNHWSPSCQQNALCFKITVSRYGPNEASGPPWLPFNLSWPAPPINTYTGPGYNPPDAPIMGYTGN